MCTFAMCPLPHSCVRSIKKGPRDKRADATDLARWLLKKSRAGSLVQRPPNPPAIAMNLSPTPDFPPPNFVAFLAQQSGLTEEAAEHRLEDWLDEYCASNRRRSGSDLSHNASLSI